MKVGLTGFSGAGKTHGLLRADGPAAGPGRPARADRHHQGARPTRRLPRRRLLAEEDDVRRGHVRRLPAGARRAEACRARSARRWRRCATPTRWSRWCAASPISTGGGARRRSSDIDGVRQRAGARRPGAGREAPRAAAQGEGQGARAGAARARLAGALEARDAAADARPRRAEERSDARRLRVPVAAGRCWSCSTSPRRTSRRRCPDEVPRPCARRRAATAWRCRRRSRWRSPSSTPPTGRRSSPTSASRESARDRFIRASYALLDLISFLTAGEDECRAWPIRRGTRRRQGGGQDPQRHRARLHPRRGGGLRRLRPASAARPSAARPASCASRARTTSSRTATSSTSGSLYDQVTRVRSAGATFDVGFRSPVVAATHPRGRKHAHAVQEAVQLHGLRHVLLETSAESRLVILAAGESGDRDRGVLWLPPAS